MNTFIMISVFMIGSSIASFADAVDWGFISLELPTTTKDVPRQGIDSSVGSLVSSDGTPEIHYDIGQGPNEAPEFIKSDYLFFQTGEIDGHIYYASVHKSDPDQFSFVLFTPGFAGFLARATSKDEIKKVLDILLKLKPKNPNNAMHRIPQLRHFACLVASLPAGSVPPLRDR